MHAHVVLLPLPLLLLLPLPLLLLRRCCCGCCCCCCCAAAASVAVQVVPYGNRCYSSEKKNRLGTIVHDADALVDHRRYHTAADVIVRRQSRTMPMREAVASIRGGAIRQPMP